MPSSSKCPRHPQSPATDLCISCGAFVCPACAWVTEDTAVYCPACKPAAVERPKRKPPAATTSRGTEPQSYIRVGTHGAGELPKPSTGGGKAKASIIIGLFGCVCFPFAIVGLALAIGELNAIKSGASSAENKPIAIVGVVLNSFAFVTLVAWMVSGAR